MKVILVFIGISLSCIGSLFAQDLNITGAGARAEGFGGAFIGIADDATAIVWNPAGLSQLERAEASFVGRYLSEKVEYTSSYYSSYNESIKQSHGVFNFGSVAAPIHMGSTRLVLAVAYQRQLDFYTNVASQSSATEGKGGVDAITPGFGINIGSVFSIGASANFWMGTYKETETGTGINPYKNMQDFDYKGFNLVAGALVDFEGLPSPIPVKLGVCIRTPFDLKADGTVKVEGMYSPVSQQSVEQTIQMPFMLGFGASARLFEHLTLAADYEMRSYADKEILETYAGEQPETYTISKDNLNQYRVGAEYLIVGKSIVIPIRGGYKSVPTVFRNYSDAGDQTEQVMGKAWSVGTGFIFSNIAIDAAFTMSEYTVNSGSVASMKHSTGTISASLIIYM